MAAGSTNSDRYFALFTHLFCLLVGLVALSVTAWVIYTGQLFTIDGLLLVAVSGALGTFFVGNTAWAAHTGELRELLNARSGDSEPSEAGPSSSSPKDKTP